MGQERRTIVPNDGIREGFIPVWPTIFIQRFIPEHEAPNASLIDFVLDMDQKTENLTTQYRNDFFTSDHPAVQWLHQWINQGLEDYFKWLGVAYRVEGAVQGWPNINRFGDYHDQHNHPGAYLSGTYYAQVPEALEKLDSRPDLRPGHITFYDPRYCANMTAIAGDPYMEGEYTVRPQPGLMLMWPAFLNHFVHPNLSKTPRISISFNIVLRPSDTQLPDTL